MLKPRLKDLLENTDSIQGRMFAFFIQFLIIISLISYSFGTLPNLTDSTKKLLEVTELVIIIVFTIEYLLRIIVSESKRKFIFSFWGLIDLFAILPFYINTGLDLRSIRAFRLFRLVKTLKLMKYSKALKRLQNALFSIKEELILFGFATLLLLYLSAVGIYHFENPVQPEVFKSIFHSLWWAVITLTTVGYGDMYPITVGGQVFTFLILILGLGVVAVPTGLLASALSSIKEGK